MFEYDFGYFQAVKVSMFVRGFPVENPTNKATASKLFQLGGEFLCPITVRRGSEDG